MKEPRWVPRVVVDFVHHDQLREHGGCPACATKRTPFVTMMTFLGLNAKDLSATELEVVEMMVTWSGGERTEQALADWVRARLVPFVL